MPNQKAKQTDIHLVATFCRGTLLVFLFGETCKLNENAFYMLLGWGNAVPKIID